MAEHTVMTSFASDKHQQKPKWVEFAIDNPDHDEIKQPPSLGDIVQVWREVNKAD